MAEWYCEVGGQRYGPVTEQQLRDWLAEGRLSGHDVVWHQGMSGWMPVSSVPELLGGVEAPKAAGAPPIGGPVQVAGLRAPAMPARGYVEPHRGAAVLTLGIVGLVVCFICGIIAWVMGSGDLAKMRAGTMDRTGEGMTRAGMICGIIGTILGAVALVVWLVVLAAAAS